MNNNLSIIFKTAFCLLFILFFQNRSSCQTVIIILNQPSPGGLNVADLWSFTLINNTNQNLNVFLEGQATEDQYGLIASGKTVSFRLNARETKRMKVSDLPRTPDITYNAQDPKYKNSLIRTGKFPPGTYEICVQVLSADTIQELGRDCLPPQVVQETVFFSLVSPDDEAEIEPIQPLIFSWIPVKEAKDYTLKIVEMQKGQSAEDAVLRNRVFFLKNNLKVISYQYPKTEQRFDSTKTYAWQVLVIGKDRNEVIMESEIRSFSVRKTPQIKEPPQNQPSTIKLKSYYELSEEPVYDFVMISNDTLNIQFINDYASAENVTFSIFDESRTKITTDSLNDTNNKIINGLNRMSLILKKYRLKTDIFYSVTLYCPNKNYYFNFKIQKKS